MLVSVVAALCCLQGAAPLGQKELLGARAAINELTTKDPGVTIAEKELAYLNTVRRYLVESPAMSASVAATKWLDLIDEGRAVPRRPLHNGGNPTPIGTIQTAIAALPRPEVWPAIVQAIRARPQTQKERVLLILFARLEGREEDVLKLCDEFAANVPKQEGAYNYVSQSGLKKVKYAVWQRAHDWKTIVDNLEKEVAGGPQVYVEGTIPDLASLVPTGEAQNAILRLLKAAKQPLYIQDLASNRLAKEVLLSHLSEISFPHWNMATEAADTELVRKLVAKFGVDSLANRENQSAEAQGIYLTDLLLRGDLNRATEFLKKLAYPPQLWSRYGTDSPPEFLGKLYAPLVELQKRMPESDLTSQIVGSAAVSGNAASAAQIVQKVLTNPRTKTESKFGLFTQLLELYSSVGDIPGVLRTFDQAAKVKWPWPDWDLRSNHLLPMGLLLHDQAMIDQGIASEKKLSYAARHMDLLDALVGQKRFAEAEQIVQKAFKKDLGTSLFEFNCDDYVYPLCRIYYAAGRPQDVLTVLRDFPSWSGGDLSEVVHKSFGGSTWDRDESRPPIGYFAAWAFSKTGQKELAIRTLNQTLYRVIWCDQAYELLNQLSSEEALPFYKEVAKLDPEEPRPLTWQSALLLKLGKIKEAEAVVREAIRLDPSDSKSSGGHRRRAFQVLSSVLSKKGDVSGAKAAASTFKAAQIEEKAETWAKLGFLPQAAAAFRESLQLSGNDYLAEDGLSKCLNRMGRFKEGAVHHSSAFELLPSCIGRATDLYNSGRFVTDFSFEGINSEGVKKVAALAQNSAPAAYVYGKYFKENGFPKRAVERFQKAVEFDPKYLIAWQELAFLGKDGMAAQDKTEKAFETVFELGGLREYRNGCDWGAIRDLRAPYQMIFKRVAEMPDISDSRLFPLHRASQSYPFGVHLPWLEFPRPAGSPPGSFFQVADDITEIIRAYGDWP